ncbi:MAG: hypothetical protein KY476_06685, partial [Planctomycetes bacterium]|nr:hypothetical protein [Planctomycetota bacterium]
RSTSQTLLCAERMDAGPGHSISTLQIAFVIGRDRLTFQSGAGARGPLHLAPNQRLGPFSPNADRDPAIGLAPGPGSNHVDSFQVSFCDGRSTVLSNTIDSLIYARLLTPAGQHYGQEAVADDDY